MDCAEDCLSLVGEFAEEITDCPGCLAVEAGGWFVEEEEEFGFRGEFDADCETFALLGVQTWRSHMWLATKMFEVI